MLFFLLSRLNLWRTCPRPSVARFVAWSWESESGTKSWASESAADFLNVKLLLHDNLELTFSLCYLRETLGMFTWAKKKKGEPGLSAGQWVYIRLSWDGNKPTECHLTSFWKFFGSRAIYCMSWKTKKMRFFLSLSFLVFFLWWHLCLAQIADVNVSQAEYGSSPSCSINQH